MARKLVEVYHVDPTVLHNDAIRNAYNGQKWNVVAYLWNLSKVQECIRQRNKLDEITTRSLEHTIQAGYFEAIKPFIQ